ncbi:hypothetical protein M422DRAFT_777827 [Sphaerobolus stellatus SS14]|nr:hypothetical protein M422DRAFT_777827 [Sphaerobolus stellatus SS14]
MAESNIDSRIDALAKDIESLATKAQNKASRKKLLDVVTKAMGMLETPSETVWKIIMSPHAPAALMVMMQMGVINDLVKGGKPKTAKELSTSCGGDEMLIIRMMRPLVALGICHETDVQTYASTPVSEALTTPALSGGFQYMFDLATRSLANMPRYLKRTGYKHVSGSPGPFQDCNNTDDGLFPYLMRNPEMMSNFNAFMSGVLVTRPNWFDIFPAREIVLDGAKTDDPDAVLLIDVAGGEGHDIAAFHRAFPNASGRLVLQDLPPVIDNIKALDAAITRQKHDFFQPQPVSGARTYYFRNIFHDWPDENCVTILKHTAAAMTREYSKMLIFEWILPVRDVPLYPALLDVNMMAVLNGMERTEAQWTALLAQAGLKIVKFHKAGADAEGLIEAELAD